MQQAVQAGEFSRAYELDLEFHEACCARLAISCSSRCGSAWAPHPVPGFRKRVMDRELRKTVELHRRIVGAFRKAMRPRSEPDGIEPREVERLAAGGSRRMQA